MRSFSFLADKLDKMADKFDEKLEKRLEKTSQQICEDIKSLAPGNGTYRESIKVYPIEKTNDGMKVFIGSDMMVGPTIWGDTFGSNNVPAGTKYNLGYLLEHGTYEHAIPNAFDRGRKYKPEWKSPQFYATLQDDWHPGSIAQPHYSLALEKNKKLFKDSIREAWRQ